MFLTRNLDQKIQLNCNGAEKTKKIFVVLGHKLQFIVLKEGHEFNRYDVKMSITRIVAAIASFGLSTTTLFFVPKVPRVII